MKNWTSFVFALGVLFSASAYSSDGVDVHMHLSPGRPPNLDFKASVETLIAKMDQLGIGRVIVMPPPQVQNQTTAYLADQFMNAIHAHSGRLLWAAGGDELNPIIHSTPPGSITAEIRNRFESIARRIVADGAKAFGEMAALHFSFNPRHPFEQSDPDHPLFLLLADIAAQTKTPIDLHVEAVITRQPVPKALASRSPNNPATIQPTISGLEKLLAHNRNATIVWQHIGWDNTGHLNVKLLRGLLTRHPNLFLALKHVD
ncbi:MAG: hypothetical protein AAB425_01770, partial [Bdellovibrionota bacterium]